MKNFRITLIALALVLMAAPAWAVPNSLGVAGSFNTFVFKDFHGSSDTQGRLAVGRNAQLKHYSVGDQLPAGSTGPALVVGGNMHLKSGQFYGGMTVGGNADVGQAGINGHVSVGGDMKFKGGQINGDLNVRGKVKGPNYQFYSGQRTSNPEAVLDFAAEQARLTGLSSSLSQLGSTGGMINNYGGLSLSGNGQNGMQVFNLNGKELMSSWGMTLDGVPDGATVLINVSGNNAGLTNMNLEQLIGNRSNILFNFYEARNLKLSGVAVQGSILAPLADVKDAQGVIWGTLIANSFHGSMQQNLVPFEGNISPTPIPGAVWLLGSGLAGLVALRRKRS